MRSNDGFISHASVRVFIVFVYNTQAEFEMRYLAGKVWIYRGELRYVDFKK